MPDSLPRRSMLLGGAALAASAVLASPSVAGAATRGGTDAPPHTIVRWNAAARRWAPRPPHAEFGVVFLSTNDPAATAPKDKHMKAGDVWRRHPDAPVHDSESEGR